MAKLTGQTVMAFRDVSVDARAGYPITGELGFTLMNVPYQKDLATHMEIIGMLAQNKLVLSIVDGKLSVAVYEKDQDNANSKP